MIMTIEEKAKAYDEALERARIWQNHLYETNDRDYADELNYIFPKLKENDSGDERIRKAILNYLTKMWGNCKDDICGAHVEDAIDWLEKQGEQKSIDNKEKLNVLKFIRKETCCGLAEANNALLKLIEVLKEHPLPIMDKPRKLKIEWDVGKKELKKSDDEKKSVNEVMKIRQELYQSGYNDGYKHGQEDIAMSLKKESIEALEHFVRSIGESGYASPYDNRTKLVYALLEQLKQIVK